MGNISYVLLCIEVGVLWYKVIVTLLVFVCVQALHCCMTWILDLAIPSPRTSPSSSASATAGANSSLN